MPTRLNVRVYENRQIVYEDDFEGALELGRQDRGEPEPFKALLRDGRDRLIIARGGENDVGRRHALLEPLPDGRLRLHNRSTSQPIRLQEGREVAPGSTCELALPLVLALGQKTVRVQGTQVATDLHGLPGLTLRPGAGPPVVPLPALTAVGGNSVERKALVSWLHALLDVVQAAAGSADFFERAAGAAVDMVNLDSSQVLLLQDGQWRPQAVRLSPKAPASAGRRPSRAVLARVLQDRGTFWEVLAPAANAQESLAGVDAVVAAPILDVAGNVLGALYGERRRWGSVAATGPITEVEAMLIELLARGVAAGLARLDEEHKALAERVRFEQFFTPELARQMALQPDLLRGRDTEVSVLFCDIRGFSRIIERITKQLGSAKALEWLQDALDALSECVLEEGGALVDYVGDELMAMWGAPGAQPDHTARACRAALAMLARLPGLNAHWGATMGEPLDVGIGINTGIAQVGNTGSHFKFKYGALGNTVNLASRTQGLTRHLKCRVLINRSTREQLGTSFLARRLGRFRVVNIAQEVELYELAPPDRPGWAEACAEYEKALALFERGELGLAVRTLGNWRGQRPDDDTALVLLYRAVKCMVEGTPETHPTWVLTEK